MKDAQTDAPIAVIFDMDGVLSDTQGTWAELGSAMLSARGKDVPPHEITRKYAGTTIEDSLGRELPGEDPRVLAGELFEAMGARLAVEVAPIPGAQDAVRALHRARIPLAVASGAPLRFIERILAQLDIRECFFAIASNDEVARGKPAPDVFLLAASRLGIDPRRCVVVEDGYAGIAGARAAGMKIVAFRAIDAAADLHVDTMDNLTIERIRNMF